MDKGMTVKELLDACVKAVADGYSNRHIQISCDDEGNGFHSLFYGFDEADKYMDLMPYGIDNAKEIIVLG